MRATNSILLERPLSYRLLPVGTAHHITPLQAALEELGRRGMMAEFFNPYIMNGTVLFFRRKFTLEMPWVHTCSLQASS
jgi:hypothetical protein